MKLRKLKHHQLIRARVNYLRRPRVITFVDTIPTNTHSLMKRWVALTKEAQ